MSEKNIEKTASKKPAEKESFFKKFVSFFKKAGVAIAKYCRSLIAEIKAIVWPSVKQTTNNTLIVIIMVAIVGAFVAVLDVIYSQGIGWLVK